MQKVGEFWLPDEDLRYHWHRLFKAGKRRRKVKQRYADGKGPKYDDIKTALTHVQGTEVAIDGGANVGAYSRAMARHFDRVHAFEPAPDTFAALSRNLGEWGLADRVSAYNAAISDRHENVSLGLPRGSRSVSRYITGPGDIPTMLIDDLELAVVDFIKLDLEGYEYRALLGAQDTLKRCRPIVMFEDKGKSEDSNLNLAHEYLRSLGARLITRVGRGQFDWLYGFSRRSGFSRDSRPQG